MTDVPISLSLIKYIERSAPNTIANGIRFTDLSLNLLTDLFNFISIKWNYIHFQNKHAFVHIDLAQTAYTKLICKIQYTANKIIEWAPCKYSNSNIHCMCIYVLVALVRKYYYHYHKPLPSKIATIYIRIIAENLSLYLWFLALAPPLAGGHSFFGMCMCYSSFP